MPERGFLIFWIFLLFLSELCCPGRVWTEFGTKIFFFSFSAYLIPFCIKIMPEIGFLIFLIFLLFFSQFSSLAEFEWNSGLNFVFLFYGLSHPVLAKNNAGKRFFNFFAIFFEIFLPGFQYERNSGLKFFSPYLGLPHFILAWNIAWKRFFNFLNFFAIFFGIFFPVSSMNGIRD